MPMRILALLMTLVASAAAQEYGLKDYLQLLNVAPGRTVNEKVATLNQLGIKLSAQGMRDLMNIDTPQPAARPSWPSYPSTPSNPVTNPWAVTEPSAPQLSMPYANPVPKLPAP